jgi:hypothetical protein
MKREVRPVRERTSSLVAAIPALIVGLACCAIGCGSGRGAELPLSHTETNVILFTLCSLRADHLGVYGYPKNTSPRLDQLAREGVLFEEVLTPAP